MAHLLLLEFLEAVAAVMVHCAGQRLGKHTRGVGQALADVEEIPVGVALVEEADFRYGPEAGVVHASPADIVHYLE